VYILEENKYNYCNRIQYLYTEVESQRHWPFEETETVFFFFFVQETIGWRQTLFWKGWENGFFFFFGNQKFITDLNRIFDQREPKLAAFVCSIGFSTATGGWLLMKKTERYKFYLISTKQLLAECRKTETKVITLANHRGRRQSTEPIKTPSNYM